MIPKHKNPSYKNRVAVAPYNFVPLPEAILTVEQPPVQASYDPELLTGKLTCKLTTASPMYVRAARTIEEYHHKDSQDKPAPITPSDPFYGESKETLLIPGSSLRGMLRTLVEVVSYSRLAPVTRKPLFFRTVDVSSIGKAYSKEGWYTVSKAGYMELVNGDYCIRPAQEFHGVQHFRVEEELALECIPGLKNMAIREEFEDRQGNKKVSWKPNSRRNNPRNHYRWGRFEVWFRPKAPSSHKPLSYTYFAEVTEIQTGQQKPAGGGWEQGWLIASGWVPSRMGPGKHRHWIVGPPVDDNDQLIHVSDEDIDLYRERGGGITQAIESENMDVLPTTPGQRVPCFYTLWEDEEGQTRVAIGHTGMFRLPYQKSPAELLPDKLKQTNAYDLAEAMFGFVDQGKSQRSALAGRVFVTDAILQGDPSLALMDLVTLSDQALSGPKPTTIQHYLTQGKPDDPEDLKHYDNNPNTETTLRGHKFYWHVGPTEEVQKRLSTAPPIRINDQLNKFRPVKEKQVFKFEIHFENLRLKELGALLWVLDKAADDHYRLKLGMGKPYGLGSVAISFTSDLTVRKNRYDSLFNGDSWNLGKMPEKEANQKLEDAQKAFQDWVLSNHAINPEPKASKLDELPRLRELLALLSWQGRLKPEHSRYMNLDEFTGRQQVHPNLGGRASRRPVLPAASSVLNPKWFPGLSDEAPRSQPMGSRPPGKRATPPLITPQPPVAPPQIKPPTPPTPPRAHPPKQKTPEPVNKVPGELQPGDVIRAIVYEDPPARGDVILIPEKASEEDMAVIRASSRTTRRYRKGDSVLLKVLECLGDSKSGFEIVCEPLED